MNHYLDRGFYPIGGGGGIVKAMTNAIKKHGGQIKVKQSVEKIIIENNKTISIKLKDGQTIFANNIISNADPTTTYLKLIGKEFLSKKLIQKLEKTKYSVYSFILFLTLEIDVTK